MTAEVDARPAILNLRLYAGDDFSRAFQITDANGTGIDITSWTLLAQIREAPGADLVLATFTITVTDAANGNFTLELGDGDIDDLERGRRLAWDLQATVSSSVRTYVRGSVMVDTDVSRTA